MAPKNPDIVGYLHHKEGGFYVICRECRKTNTAHPGTPIFFDNIYPYKQSCDACHTVIVAGQSDSWPELFNGK